MSLFRDLFDIYAVPTLLDTFNEPDVDIVYEIGGNQTRLQGYSRAKRVEMREDEYGDVLRVTRRQIVFSTDPFSQWGGVADPQIKAQYLLTDLTTMDTARYAVESQEAPAYEHISESLVAVNLVNFQGMSKAAPSYRS